MARIRYCTVEDVARRFDPRIAESDLLANDVLGESDIENIKSRIDAVQAKWDRQATPMRAVQIGSEDAPKYFPAKGDPWPVRVYLNHRNIRPLDANDGDFIRTRTSRDSYTDITGQEGSAWTADYDDGIITVYRLPGAGALPAFRRIREKFVKISYSLAAGGDLSSAGETTLTESIEDDTTGTVSVSDASRLPRGGEIMLLGGQEYAYVTAVDRKNNTITIDAVADRGVRRTPAEAHDSGDAVHFCPVDVRDAVAAKTAVELATTEDFTEWLLDSNDIDRNEKIDVWNDEWADAVNAYSTAAGYS